MSCLGKDKDDFTCPICMYIMIHPVTMPCKHSLCLLCYKQCVEKTNLACPICRLRIAVWARKNAKGNTLIDRVMWETIQRNFPVEVRNRIEGRDDSTDDGWDCPSAIETKLRKLKELSEPGAIRQEYEAALAKLERQREEEAKKEAEASAALIRALQEEEEEELAKLAKQREENERLGRLAAEQFQETHADTDRRLRDAVRKKKDSKKRCESASMRLESFYNSYRKSSNSAPPHSEFATTLSNKQGKCNTGWVSKTDYSPYPYHCISPSEKQKATTTPPSEEMINEEDEITPYLQEHSYTTASAERIDLTLQDGSSDWTSILREDVQQYIKVEPPDINEDEDPLCGISNDSASHIFQPICSSLQTPPKKLPSGELVDPVLIRSIPRSLNFCFGEGKSGASPSVSSCSSEIVPDQSSDFRELGSGLISHKEQELSLSESLCNGQSNHGESNNEFVDKMNLTRKIVYGTSKFKKSRPVSSTSISSSSSNTQSSLFSADPVTSSPPPLFKTSLCVNNSSSMAFLKPVSVNDSWNADNDNKTVDKHKHQNDEPDYFISHDTELIIPLESEVESNFSLKCDNEQNTSHKTTLKKTPSNKLLQKKVSKSVDPPRTNSIRDWCLKGKHKANSDMSNVTHNDINSSVSQNHTPEDADYQLALELQKLYDQQDRYKISVDRFQGSSNEYSFRKKRRLC